VIDLGLIFLEKNRPLVIDSTQDIYRWRQSVKKIGGQKPAVFPGKAIAENPRCWYLYLFRVHQHHEETKKI